MISSEVERTLVKSPPELWAELSDPTALSRHLGELGEIRITRTEPESTVEWTAENTTGTVSLKPSGWGTKVKLSVTRELDPHATAAEAASTAEPETDADLAAEPEAAHAELPTASDTAPTAAEAVPSGSTDVVEVDQPPLSAADLEPRGAAVPKTSSARDEPQIAPEPRRGFFARLFGRRRARVQRSEQRVVTDLARPADETNAEPADERKAEPVNPSELGDAFAAVRRALAPETFAASQLFATRPERRPRPSPKTAVLQAPSAQTADAPQSPEPQATDDSPPAQTHGVDISAELMAAEEMACEQVTAVLTAALDRLGAAHHRPFSRA